MKFLQSVERTQDQLVNEFIGKCKEDLLRHELERWHASDGELIDRLDLMKNPEKIRCFITIAAIYNDVKMYYAGIKKARELNYNWIVPRFAMISLLRDVGEDTKRLIRKIRV